MGLSNSLLWRYCARMGSRTAIVEAMAKTADQRRFARTHVELPIVVRSMASAASLIRGHSLNLSEGGAGGILSGELMPGQVVLMELMLNTEEAVRVNARVRHCTQPYCGFEFLGPDGDV